MDILEELLEIAAALTPELVGQTSLAREALSLSLAADSQEDSHLQPHQQLAQAVCPCSSSSSSGSCELGL